MPPAADCCIAESITAAIIESAIYAGASHRIAADIARMAAERLNTSLGGSQLYIRRTKPTDRAAVRRDFTGNNIQELAAKYGLTSRRVRQILIETKDASWI